MPDVCFTLSAGDVTKFVGVYTDFYDYDADVLRRIDEGLPAITENEFSRLKVIDELKQSYAKKKDSLLNRANVPDSIDPT